jgi:hypothetical protein
LLCNQKAARQSGGAASEGVFLARDLEEAKWFVEMGRRNARDALDVWESGKPPKEADVPRRER